MFLDLLIASHGDLEHTEEPILKEVNRVQELLPIFALKVPIITIGELKSWPTA